MPDVSREPEKPYRDPLLAFVAALRHVGRGQMTLERSVTDTYPDPAKTSWNDMVSWRASLTFGSGYFTGAVVRYVGRWAVPHPTAGDAEGYGYAEMEKDLPVEEAVDAFLSDTIPEWVGG